MMILDLIEYVDLWLLIVVAVVFLACLTRRRPFPRSGQIALRSQEKKG